MSGSGHGAREGAVEVGDTESERWPDGSFDATARIVDARLDDHDSLTTDDATSVRSRSPCDPSDSTTSPVRTACASS